MPMIAGCLKLTYSSTSKHLKRATPEKHVPKIYAILTNAYEKLHHKMKKLN